MTVSRSEDLGLEPGGMTPWLAFAISLIYCVAADRDVDAYEVGRLVSAFGGKVSPDVIEVGATHRDLFHRAVQYVRTRKSDDFLTEATPILSEKQRLTILLNMVDSALADSRADPAERKLLEKFSEGVRHFRRALPSVFRGYPAEERPGYFHWGRWPPG